MKLDSLSFEPARAGDPRIPRLRLRPSRLALHRTARALPAALLAALLAACQTTPSVNPPGGPGTITHLPPGNSERDGPEAHPPPDLDKVPDAIPQIEPLRTGGPNKPYEVAGHTYVPLTDDRAVTETGLASWYGKKFHGHRTASGESYNMYAMTAAHKTLPIPSYARVRNPANGHEVIVRVNDRGPFSPGRIIDLSYTAALKLGVLNGVQPVEVTRITADDIRSGAALARLQAPVSSGTTPTSTPEEVQAARKAGESLASVVPPRVGGRLLPPAPGDVIAQPANVPAALPQGAPAPGNPAARPAGIDLGAAAAADTAAAVPLPAASAAPPSPPSPPSPPASAASSAVDLPPLPDARDERAHPETTAGTGYWVQIGAYKQRDGALEMQHRLIDEQPWLAPLLAVFSDRGYNKLQAGPYPSRDEARSVAQRLRQALHLAPTIVDKR